MKILTRLRRFWLDVHLWVGVALFIPLAVLGVTGSVLTFHDELDRLVAPQRYEATPGAPAPLDDLFNAARAALPDGFVVMAVRPSDDAEAPAQVQARSTGHAAPGVRPETRTVFVDPVSAAVRDVSNTRADAFGIMHQLHGTLMIPDVGRKVVGWLGWAMLISSLTGLWLWWPRTGAMLKGLRWARSPRTTTNLHHLTGFWIAIPLAILSFTGAYISFPQFSRTMLGAVIPLSSDAPRPGGGFGGPPPIAHPHLSADAALQAALAAVPGAHAIAVNLPVGGRDGEAPAWRVQVKLADQEAFANISVDDATGIAEAPHAAPAADQNVARWMRRLHDGTNYSPVWRVVIALAGMAPALLGVTGIAMWMRRRAARRAIKRGHAPTPI